MASVGADRNGFSLLELLLAVMVGCTLVAVIGEALLGELGQSGRLARMLRERTVSERAVELMRSELQEAEEVIVMPGPIERAGCGLAKRKVLLHLGFSSIGSIPRRDVIYSIERSPASIWRGHALMRCGPAYGLDGHMNDSELGSHVLLDALNINGFTMAREGEKSLELRLQRAFSAPNGRLHQLETTAVILVPGLR
jgi:prepilin-type N-terminal cleavage/methylation domain-containing protein